jgi:hypothetical protein
MEAALRGTEGVGGSTGRGAGLAAEVGRGFTPGELSSDGIRHVALGEMALRRRRLGELTPEQERALESLLLTVADNISDLVSGVTAGDTLHARVDEARAAVVHHA